MLGLHHPPLGGHRRIVRPRPSGQRPRPAVRSYADLNDLDLPLQPMPGGLRRGARLAQPRPPHGELREAPRAIAGARHQRGPRGKRGDGGGSELALAARVRRAPWLQGHEQRLPIDAVAIAVPEDDGVVATRERHHEPIVARVDVADRYRPGVDVVHVSSVVSRSRAWRDARRTCGNDGIGPWRRSWARRARCRLRLSLRGVLQALLDGGLLALREVALEHAQVLLLLADVRLDEGVEAG